MKKFIAMLVTTALIATGLSGCGSSSPQDNKTEGEEGASTENAADIGDTVNFMFWGGFISEDIFKDFEEEYGCHVNVSYITNTDELIAKMVAGNHGLDLIHLEHAYVKTFVEGDLLQPYNPDNVPNIKNFTDESLKPVGDEDYVYTIPDGFYAAYTSLIYNKETCPMEIKSFKDLANPEFKGQLLLPESTVTLFGTALDSLGYKPDSENEAEYEEAYNLLMDIKPNLKAMVGATGVPQLENGDASVALLYGSDWINLMSRPENREKYAIADIEGYEAPLSYYAITNEAEHKEAAEVLANYLLENDAIAKTTEEYKRIPVVGMDAIADKVSDSIKENPGFNFPDYVKEKAWTQSVNADIVAIMDKYYTLFKS